MQLPTALTEFLPKLSILLAVLGKSARRHMTYSL